MIKIKSVGFGSMGFRIVVSVSCPNCKSNLVEWKKRTDTEFVFKCKKCNNRFAFAINLISSAMLGGKKVS